MKQDLNGLMNIGQVRKTMNNNFDRVEIGEYLEEYAGLENAISVLQDRQNTIDDILRNEYNFVIGKDRYINVGG